MRISYYLDYLLLSGQNEPDIDSRVSISFGHKRDRVDLCGLIDIEEGDIFGVLTIRYHIVVEDLKWNFEHEFEHYKPIIIGGMNSQIRCLENRPIFRLYPATDVLRMELPDVMLQQFI